MEREVVAYALILVILLVGSVWASVAWRARKREKLRRRGIKRYGH